MDSDHVISFGNGINKAMRPTGTTVTSIEEMVNGICQYKLLIPGWGFELVLDITDKGTVNGYVVYT